MANTIGEFEQLKWQTKLYEYGDLYLINNNSVAQRLSKNNILTGQTFLTEITINSASSGIDLDNNLIYMYASGTQMNVYDLDTELLVNTVTFSASIGSSSSGAFNPQDGRMYFRGGAAPEIYRGINVQTGDIEVIFNNGYPGPPAGNATGISDDGVFYHPKAVDIGGGQWEMRMWTSSPNNPTAVMIASQTFPNPIFPITGGTWHRDNKIYFGANNIGTYDIETQQFDLVTGITVPGGNTLTGYIVDSTIKECFTRSYQQNFDGSIEYKDFKLDGTNKLNTIRYSCYPSVPSRSIRTQDDVLTTGQSLILNSNTYRSVIIQSLLGTVNINGTTLPNNVVFQVGDDNANYNSIDTQYTINNVTDTTLVFTTRYI